MVFFEPLINLINSGNNLLIQQGAGLIIFKLIEYINNKNEIFNEPMKLLEIIAKKYLNAFLKGTPLDNHYAVESLYLLMTLVKFDIFNDKLKDLYAKLINYLKYK